MSELFKYIVENNSSLRKYPNILNIGEHTKYKDGVDTGVPCISFYVSEKKTGLTDDEKIPKTVGGYPTDVVELKPVKWALGKTGIGERDAETQRRMCSGAN